MMMRDILLYVGEKKERGRIERGGKEVGKRKGEEEERHN